MPEPVWSIILASRNGADTLPRCLSALEGSVGRDPEVEVLLVDNASTDETPEIMQAFCDRLSWQCLAEPRVGKAFALNSAISHARGDWLLFIDDDILTSAEWLSAYRSAAERHPTVSLLAGRIRPEWEDTPPLWLVAMADQGKACGCTDPLAGEGLYSAQDVKGGNFAIRRGALGSVRFDEAASNFGASQQKPTGGLDTKIAAQLAPVDRGIVHIPEAAVGHIISAAEMRRSAVFERQKRIGRNYAAAHQPTFASILKTCAKILVFGSAAPVAMLLRRHQLLGRSILGMATNLGRLERWLN